MQLNELIWNCIKKNYFKHTKKELYDYDVKTKILLKIDLILTSISSRFNNCFTISKFSFSTAKNNGVL